MASGKAIYKQREIVLTRFPFSNLIDCFNGIIFCFIFIGLSATQGIADTWPIMDKDGKVIPCDKLYKQYPNLLLCRIQELDSDEKYKDAVPLAEELLKIKEEMESKRNLGLNMVATLNIVAKINYKAGNYERAEGLYKRALERGKSSPPMWKVSAEGLLQIYAETSQKEEEIEKIIIDVIKLFEGAFGKESIISMPIYAKAGDIYFKNAKYEIAENYYKKALKAQKKGFEELASKYTGVEEAAKALAMLSAFNNNPQENKVKRSAVRAINNLAFVYYKLGQYEKIKALYVDDFSYFTKIFSSNPILITIFNNFANIFGDMDHKFSHDLFVKTYSLNDKVTASGLFITLSSAGLRVNYFRNLSQYVHSFISHTSQYMRLENDAVRDTFSMWAKYKGSVIDFESRLLTAVKNSEKSDVKRKFKEYKELDAQLSGFPLANDVMSQDKYMDIKVKKIELASDLGSSVTSYLKSEDIDIGQLIDTMPKDSVYVDFAKINLFDFKNQKFGEEQYVAFVIHPNKTQAISLTVIGTAIEIDGLIGDYRKALESFLASGGRTSFSAKMKQISVNLYDKILRPLESYIDGQKKIIISPDGELNLIPFEVFVKPDGKYLIEDYSISYITNAKDILRFKRNPKLDRNAVIMADPDYDFGIAEKSMEDIRGDAIYFRERPSNDMNSLTFRRLPDTKYEANSIEKILKEKMKISVRNFQDKDASDKVLYSVKSPQILHIATHGFFLKSLKIELKKDLLTPDEKEEKVLIVVDPMLRSGIVLSGANTAIQTARGEGIMTANKIVGLDLKDTELVVLSACDTGVGNVEKGDGVYGLRKSFVLAGAKSLVASLWSVPSIETTELMIQFYSSLSEGKSKAEALREAKLGMLKKKENPFYWGAFVLSGNPN